MATEEPVLDRTSKKNMTMFRIFLSILLISGFFLIGERAKAQTCRVNIGVSAAGCTSYMEVFEYDYVSEKPSFPGGDAKMMTFVNEHRCYPHEAYRRGVQGRVTCSFVVNTDGSISHISVLRGVERGNQSDRNHAAVDSRKDRRESSTYAGGEIREFQKITF